MYRTRDNYLTYLLRVADCFSLIGFNMNVSFLWILKGVQSWKLGENVLRSKIRGKLFCCGCGYPACTTPNTLRRCYPVFRRKSLLRDWACPEKYNLWEILLSIGSFLFITIIEQQICLYDVDLSEAIMVVDGIMACAFAYDSTVFMHNRVSFALLGMKFIVLF